MEAVKNILSLIIEQKINSSFNVYIALIAPIYRLIVCNFYLFQSLEMKGSELFCHKPLTGDILRSPNDMDGEFQMEQQFKAGFCLVKQFLEPTLDFTP